ncbi:phosphotransferase family protein [Ilumatobacter nonamiensis]|uniref:phosphotransferase family protein n=1 Tax=Ilumatobacter nonamiensis TaxID=467093 RepID=UPI000347713F|nr:phosphotransferase family protein [Ilumatobacter nonamiensis]
MSGGSHGSTAVDSDPLVEPLAAWLSEVEGRCIHIARFERVSAGARRVNALLDIADDQGTRRLALTLNQSADIEIVPVRTEAEVRTLAESAGVPVPHIHHVHDRTDVLGGPFFLSTAISGLTIPRHIMRRARDRSLGPTIVGQLGTAMARLHSLDPGVAPAELPRPETGRPIADSLARLDEQMALLQHPSPTFSLATRWLERHAPSEPDRLAIVHGDIRVGNVIVDDAGVAAILDWETCHLGDAMEDLAWPTLRMWRFREDENRVGGLGSIPALREAYAAADGGWHSTRFEWWRLLSTVRWGISLAGQARSHLDGRHRSIVMAASGRRVAELEYDTLMLLNPARQVWT